MKEKPSKEKDSWKWMDMVELLEGRIGDRSSVGQRVAGRKRKDEIFFCGHQRVQGPSPIDKSLHHTAG